MSGQDRNERQASLHHDIEQILAHYRFGEGDAQRLRRLWPLFQSRVEGILPGFYDFIFSFEHARAFLGSAEVMERHRTGIQRWFMALVQGRYDAHYFKWLAGISEIHVRIGLPGHYVNAAFSYVRGALSTILLEEGMGDSLASLNKILDINLDILSLSYLESEQQQLLGDVVLLKRALAEGGVSVFVQPIVSASSGELKSYECLMRIVDSESGEVHSIGPLMQTAKKIRLYRGLMELMLERALEAFARLSYGFSLNLGYEDLVDESFRELLEAKLSRFPDPSRVTFEILETDMIGDFGLVAEFIDRMRARGCSVAVDDFGSGYSNLENVLELHPDYIKVDGTIVERIVRESESRALLRSVIDMARDFDARIVAEYVSSEEIYESVLDAGVDYIQGYYISRPFPVERLLGNVES